VFGTQGVYDRPSRHVEARHTADDARQAERKGRPRLEGAPKDH